MMMGPAPMIMTELMSVLFGMVVPWAAQIEAGYSYARPRRKGLGGGFFDP